MGLGFSIGFNPQEKLIKTELEVNVRTNPEEEKQQATARFKIAFLFSVDDFDDLVHADGKEIRVSDELILALTSITHSTSRGILLTRLQGTVFKSFILPVVSPSEILNPQNNVKRED